MLEQPQTEKEIINDKFTLDTLFKRAYDHRNSDEFIRFLNFIKRFDHYSRYNTMLVYAQNRAVTFFGGETYWKKKFNRTIKEDARPYVILAPGGPVMMAYDIFETEGRLSPEELLQDGLGRRPHEVRGDYIPNKFYKALDKAFELGINVRTRPLSYFNGGYISTVISKKLEINLNEYEPEPIQFSVLLHELAHLFLGHTGFKQLIKRSNQRSLKLLQRRHLSKEAMELEAEAVAFLIMHKLGLESRSAEYIAGYIKSSELLLEINYEVIIKTADKIEGLFLR